VMCASGVRSAIAHRVISQAGMDSASLSGGILTLRATLGARAADMLETGDDRSTTEELEKLVLRLA
jgi:hypothetical protein